jgi:hypothetical protein
MEISNAEIKKRAKNRSFCALLVFLSVRNPANAWHAVIDMKKFYVTIRKRLSPKNFLWAEAV